MNNKPLKSNSPFIEKLLGNTTSGKLITIILYLCFIGYMAAMIYTTQPYPKGDEGFYISMTHNVKEYGLFNEMAKGNPVGFTIPVLFLSSLGLETRFAGEILSLLSTIAVFLGIRYIARKVFGLTGAYLQLSLVTCLLVISSVKDYWFAGSDNFYTAFFIWVLIYLWHTVESWSPLKLFLLAGALVSITALIRPLTIPFFLSSIGAMIFISFFNKATVTKKIASIACYILAFGLVFILQQYPSLKKNSNLAFERKIPDDTSVFRRKVADTTKSNYTQKLTLNNLLLEQGKKKLHKGPVYPSWTEVDRYMLNNGPNSLPNNPLQVLQWNLKYFAKYFFIGALMTIYDFIRESGLVFIFPLVFLFRSFKDYRKYAFFTSLMLIYAGIYVFIALNYVEPRDLFIPLLFTSVMGVALINQMNSEGQKRAQIFVIAQLAIVLIDLLLNIRYQIVGGIL